MAEDNCRPRNIFELWNRIPEWVQQHLVDSGEYQIYRSNGLVVMISVLHTEGLQFDPGLDHFLFWSYVGTLSSFRSALVFR